MTAWRLARSIPMSLLIGLLAGLQTQPAVLGFGLEQTENDLPNLGYARVWKKKGQTMEYNIIPILQKKRIALVAHDNKKHDLLEWAKWNKELLIEHELFATGTTGKLLEEVLGTTVNRYQSGPLGGDQQIGAKIAEGAIDFMIFFWDPLSPQPHDTDVKALLRIAVVWNIPVACNRASADFMISSTLMTGEYERLVIDYEPYRERQVEALVAENADEMEGGSPFPAHPEEGSTGEEAES